MNFLIFDIKGRYAHFRKFYTNSSSLSYSVPPRTTIEGIIAAILGYERDNYYDILSTEKLNIAVRKISPTKKIIQTLNYIKATSRDSVTDLKEGHTQIPFEMVTGDKGVIYRVYVNHSDHIIMEELEDRIRNGRFHYIPYLGAAPFNCNINYIGNFTAIEQNTNDFIEISTIIRQSLIADKGIDIKGMNLSLIKEKMSRDFFEDRIIKEVEDYIYDEEGHPLRVKLKGNFYRINGENIVLM
ncbi:type I-B CRISPR-associated protein Cas5b [Tepidibacillus sp. HK-1]|uniref:type I-B CRISPR-associated protein Cas5b n=1 Tax=Tepidibacillus sp. HK-1 TaxID=1883407 RepID=UPI000853165A|nr:type I-B CRISPR-associated protein Cas5b [Tepidibacillus sp. HK-1]GBF10029.1 CRISPR-associated protein [Tepidibacillus sp. HK-1]